jgi:hypothetical protein
MKLHGNARTCPRSRRLLVERVEAGWTLRRAAVAAGVSERTAAKWRARWRAEGERGLLDRSSRPLRQPRRTPLDRVEAVVRLRRLRMQGHGHQPREKNGPALTGHGAEAVRDAIVTSIITLPEQLRRSLVWDQGAEMAQHAQLRIDTGLQVFFCDPQSPWQRGTNENTNGLLRQYFPRGTDLSRHSADDLAAVAAALNSRPRKTLDWRTPAEKLNEYLLSSQHQTVATTG